MERCIVGLFNIDRVNDISGKSDTCEIPAIYHMLHEIIKNFYREANYLVVIIDINIDNRRNNL